MITSGDTVIKGTKTLTANQGGILGNRGICGSYDVADPESPLTSGWLLSTAAYSSYEATITTPTQTYVTGGTLTATTIKEFRDADESFSFFALTEDFLSSDEVVPAVSPPDKVIVSPAIDVNPVGTDHTVTVMVTSGDSASSGASVLFSVSGSTTTSGACTTGAEGTCTFTYSGPDLPGADIITACADNNSNGAVDPGEPCGEATKAWMTPATTAGQTTGGGQIDNAAGATKIAFGFTAQSNSKGLRGQCSVVDSSPATNIKIHCLDVVSMVQSGTHSTFFGNATFNGTPTTYRIDVDDFAEPGQGIDTFKIRTASGYSAAGVLEAGNIQIHK